MARTAMIYGLMALAAMPAWGEEFTLKFKTVPATDVMSFPGGYGTYGQVSLAKPESLKKEPKATSRHALYADCGGVVIRLDESKGDGKGYDLLLADMNQNGDLTDDVTVQRVALPRGDDPSSGPQQALFGPIEAPANKAVAGGRPVYFAQMYIFNPELLRPGQEQRDQQVGQLMFKAGWYLETTIELPGVKQKIGVYDGDANFRLGDASKPQTYTNPGQKESWYFPPGDSLLVDANKSGSFESDRLDSEASPFGPILYMGATPYKISLGTGCKSIRVEPWTDALAEVSLEPTADQVHTVTLAWERSSGNWQLLRSEVAQGKIKVPPGKYRLYECTLVGKGAVAGQVLASAYLRNPKPAFEFTAGQANTLKCGAPLDITVNAEKRKPREWEPAARQTLDPKVDSEFILQINANAIGAGGETYSGYAKGEAFKDEPAKPAFSIADSSGKRIGDGNLEYG